MSEVARIYAVLNVLGYGISFVGGPVYRLVYDATLETFSSTFMLITAGCLALSSVFMLLVIFKRKKNEESAAIETASGEI